MAEITDFFIATDADIDDAVVADGPAERFRTLETNFVDDLAITALNGIATGRSSNPDEDFYDRFYSEMSPLRYSGDGQVLFRLPAPLIAALADADEDRLTEINEVWAQTDAWNRLAERAADEARFILDELVRLAREAQAQGKKVFLWISP